MKKTIIAIGGGEIKTKQTIAIDAYVAQQVKQKVGDKRPVGLFLGTASHDSMPYFNSFRKTYTSVFNFKSDVVLSVYGEMNYDHIKAKFETADFLYVGGGDTKFLIEKWQQNGLINLVREAYERGVIIVGLSAGAICWFKDLYSDYDIVNGVGGEYKLLKGLGWFDGLVCPHYDDRQADFDQNFETSNFTKAFGLQNNSALLLQDGVPVCSLNGGANVLCVEKREGKVVKTEFAPSILLPQEVPASAVFKEEKPRRRNNQQASQTSQKEQN